MPFVTKEKYLIVSHWNILSTINLKALINWETHHHYLLINFKNDRQQNM